MYTQFIYKYIGCTYARPLPISDTYTHAHTQRTHEHTHEHACALSLSLSRFLSMITVQGGYFFGAVFFVFDEQEEHMRHRIAVLPQLINKSFELPIGRPSGMGQHRRLAGIFFN